MGSTNQLLYIQKYAEQLQGPYLEVGSKDYGNTQDIRSFFSKRDNYLGLDLSEGKGVDLVMDLTNKFEEIDAKLDGRRFGTIFCLSVLEHCEQPFVMADNMTRLLEKDGKLVISLPFAWQFHGYPSDYWRFTPEGIKKLFPRLSFQDDLGVATTPASKEISPLDENVGIISFSSKANWSKGRILRGISAKILKLLAGIGLLRWLVGNGYVLAPTMITMLGVKDKENNDELRNQNEESMTNNE